MDLTRYADNIELDNGIWHARQRSKISYPESGNDLCFQIEANSFWFRHRNDCILAMVKNFPPNGTFFDIGGGNGFVAQAFEQAGYETVLVEPGEQGVMNARKRKLKNLVCATLEDSQFKPASLPAAGAFDVVEHIADDEAFLKSLHRFLIPDGRFYLTVPAYKFLWSSEDVAAEHHRRYTVKSMSEKLRRNGFAVEYATYIFSILPLPIFLSRTIPSKLGIRKTVDPDVQTQEHKQSQGVVGNIIERVWKWELGQIAKRKPIPFGGSVLITARKTI